MCSSVLARSSFNTLIMLWKFSPKQQKPLDLSHLALGVIALYLLGLAVHSSVLISLMGMLLWGFVPGFYAIRFLKVPSISWAGELILSSAISFLGVILGLVLFRAAVPFTENSQVGFVVGVNLVLYIAYLFYRRRYTEPVREIGKEDYGILVLALLPLILFIVRSILNPYIVDQDGTTYIQIMQIIHQTHVDGSFLGARRAAFTNAVMSLNYLTQIDFLSVMKFVLPGFIWLVMGLPFALVRGLSKEKTTILAGLLVLSSGAMASEIDRVKPEIFIFLLWFPTVLWFFWTVTTKRWYYYLIGLLFAYLSFRSHDTGAIVLLTYLIAGVLLVLSYYQTWRKYITPKNCGYAVLIMLPYIFAFHLTSLLDSFRETLANIPITVTGLQFRLWFLNSYNSGGVQAGWPGWTFVMFYIFNGFTAALFFIWGFIRFKQSKSDRAGWMALALPLLSGVIYLLLSEILPRFGVYFLPDRSWVHFFYDCVIATFLICVLLKPTQRIMPAWLTWIGGISIIGGACIAVILSVVLGSLVSRTEAGGIEHIIQLPTNAVVLSSQEFNNILVTVYGGRQFIGVALPAVGSDGAPKDLASLQAYLNGQIDAGKIGIISTDATITEQQLVQTITDSKENGTVVTHTTQILSDKIETVSQGATTITASTPVYFYYSFAKTDGAQTKLGRASWVSGIDLSHRSLFADIPTTSDTYRDSASVLVRIR